MAHPKGSAGGGGRSAGAQVAPPAKAHLKRTGQTISVRRPEPVVMTAADKRFMAVRDLKAAERFSTGSGTAAFIPAKQMTRARRDKLGLTDWGSNAQSEHFRVSEFQHPNGRFGYVVAPRSGVLQKAKQTWSDRVIRRHR